MRNSPLKKIRLQAGLKQKELANALGIELALFSRTERGENKIENCQGIFEDIAEMVGVGVDTLIADQQEYQEQKRDKQTTKVREKLQNVNYDDTK